MVITRVSVIHPTCLYNCVLVAYIFVLLSGCVHKSSASLLTCRLQQKGTPPHIIPTQPEAGNTPGKKKQRNPHGPAQNWEEEDTTTHQLWLGSSGGRQGTGTRRCNGFLLRCINPYGYINTYAIREKGVVFVGIFRSQYEE